MLFDIRKQAWDDDLLKMLNIPRSMLPEVHDSSAVVGLATADLFGREIPIAGVAGDQQAALFGQACFETGDVKVTYGTGSFILVNTGVHIVRSTQGMLSTVAWSWAGEVTYALEGSVFIAGAAVQWLRDGLGIIKDSAETETLAGSVPDSGGVGRRAGIHRTWCSRMGHVMPGAILGLTRGTTRAHRRATLEGIAFSVKDIIDAMGVRQVHLSLGCGLTAAQAATVSHAVSERHPRQSGDGSHQCQSTARGAAFLAGLATGVWKDQQELRNLYEVGRSLRAGPDTGRPRSSVRALAQRGYKNRSMGG